MNNMTLSHCLSESVAMSVLDWPIILSLRDTELICLDTQETSRAEQGRRGGQMFKPAQFSVSLINNRLDDNPIFK